MPKDAARELFEAARTGDVAALRSAVSRLVPAVEPAVRRSLARQEGLVRRCRLDPDDVVQRVFERMLASPPGNPGEQDPLAVIVAWARAVALNHLLDLGRRIGREAPTEAEDVDVDAADNPGARGLGGGFPGPGAPQERRHHAMERWQLARRCADTELSRYKYLREVFDALAEDPEMSARDLARRIGLLPDKDAGDQQAARRAEQYAWKLRERVHTRLAEYMEYMDRSPQGGR